MTEKKPKEPGKRPPRPVVTHKPAARGANAGLGQKRSLAVTLVIMGAVSLGAYEAFDWIDRKLNCEPDPANPEELICKHRSGSSYRRSSSWSSSHGSSYSSHSSYSTHGVSFGGFGHSGSSYSGGG